MITCKILSGLILGIALIVSAIFLFDFAKTFGRGVTLSGLLFFSQRS